MFSKAKLKRFNDEPEGCGPPPTKYDPKMGSKSVASSIDKSARWKEEKENIPGPGTYNVAQARNEQGSPQKKSGSKSNSRFNSSSVSSTSTGSNTSELGPPKSSKPLSRSVSSRSSRSSQSEDKAALIAELENSLKIVTSERDLYKDMIDDLEKRLQCNQRQINNEEKRRQSCSTPKKANGFNMAETPEQNVQGEEQIKENVSRTKWEEELQKNLKMVKDKENEIAALKESVESLWKENDELKAAIGKEEEGKESTEALRSRILSIEAQLQESQSVIARLTAEKTELDHRVKEMQEFAEQKSLSDDELKKLREENEHLLHLRDNLESSLQRKDELIVEAKMQLELVVEESRNCQDQLEHYESRILSLEDSIRESFEKKSEAEVHVKSLVAKYEALVREHHVYQQFHKDIIGQKDIEIELLNDSLATMNVKVSKYEQSIVSLQEAMYDREGKISSLESAVGDLSLRTKEKEVMECMLQDEIQCKEVEVNNLEEGLQDLKARIALMFEENEGLSRNLEEEKCKGRDLVHQMQQLELQLKEKEVLQQFLEKEIGSREAELETARQVAIDLQEETEGMLNEVLSLKAIVNTKDYDIDEKEEKITKLNEKNVENEKRISNMMEKLNRCEETLGVLEGKYEQLQESNKELEERVVELMAEVSDREAEHKKRVEAYEADLGEMSIKYSESLLDHEATRRALKHTAEELDKEKFLRLGTEGDLEAMKEESMRWDTEKDDLERNLHDLTEKFTALETALASTEMENMVLEEKMKKEVNAARTETACAQNEIKTLQTSNTGFLSQITQLKERIDRLREEKAHLVTLRDNLEANVATKEKALEDLNNQRTEERLRFEEREGALHSKIGDLENHLKEAEEELADYKVKTMELENKLESKEEERVQQVKANEKQVNVYMTQVSSLTYELESLRSHYEGYDDHINNLQTSLLEKTGEADQLQQTKQSLNHTLETLEEEKSKLESSVFSLKEEVGVLNTTLATKEESLLFLNDSLAAKNQELEKLSTSLEEKQMELETAEKKIKEAEERVKTASEEKKEFEKELDQTRATVKALEGNINRLKEHEEKANSAAKRFEEELLQALANAERLEKALGDMKEKNAYMEALIEPFREQLDAFEAEKIGLLSKSSAAQEEINKLSKQYAALLGHTNHKQKVHHVQKLKMENNQLRDEVIKHMQEMEKQRKVIKRLEEKLERSGVSSKRSTLLPARVGDKENLSFQPDASTMAMSSTPLKPSNKPQRL